MGYHKTAWKIKNEKLFSSIYKISSVSVSVPWICNELPCDTEIQSKGKALQKLYSDSSIIGKRNLKWLLNFDFIHKKREVTYLE